MKLTLWNTCHHVAISVGQRLAVHLPVAFASILVSIVPVFPDLLLVPTFLEGPESWKIWKT